MIHVYVKNELLGTYSNGCTCANNNDLLEIYEFLYIYYIRVCSSGHLITKVSEYSQSV